MAAEEFFARWSRRNAESEPGKAASPDKASVGSSEANTPAALPKAPVPATQEEVEKLTLESDYTPFVARGVDENVKRSALKKLFTDPHYNVMDGLDIYIGDYNTFEPIPAALLATMNHAKALLNPFDESHRPSLLFTEDAVKSPKPGTTRLQDAEPAVAPADPEMATNPDMAPDPAPEPTDSTDEPMTATAIDAEPARACGSESAPPQPL